MRSVVLCIAVVIATLAPLLSLRAAEGMWLPHQLPELEAALKQSGLKIDPAQLTDLTEYPMNAVIHLGGCTASFVSPEGLAVTNHHCAYGALQYNSTEEHNLLDDGFIARKKSEEIPAGPGSRILVTVSVDDVTDGVLGKIDDALGGRERYLAIEKRQKQLVAACEKEPGHRCSVNSFHGGLEYFLLKKLEIRDVRLVYAPPQSVGRFGGDVDNWIWPRHTGDFTFYRAYVGKDGKPAEHSEDNVPYRPRHHLRVSTAGVDEGDFVMVAGYPGRTNRYRTAQEVESTFAWSYPTRKRLREEQLTMIAELTADRPDAALKYASRVSSLNNSTKNYQGMLDGFAKGDLLERKREEESRLLVWIESDPTRRERYLDSVVALRELIDEGERTRERAMYYQASAGRNTLLSAARTLYRLSRESRKPDAEREPGYQERDLKNIRARLTRLDRRFDAAVDRALWRTAIVHYAAIPIDQHVAAFDAWFGIEGNSLDEEKLDARLEQMYAGTALTDQEQRLEWIGAKPSRFERSDDPFVRLAVALWESDEKMKQEQEERGGKLTQLRPRYMSALIDYLASQGRAVYPDANGTLRVSYGQVRGYSPRDALSYTPFTTLNGLLEKESGVEPFDSPPPLLAAIEQRRFGRWKVESLDSVPVNFLATLDSTGGNSGSPVLDGKGQLVGLLFDGNYESIIADWDFLPRITRSIQVDMRYVLWIMSEVEPAEPLLREMNVESGVAGRGSASPRASSGL